jgi:uncharacterized ferredoxin-like protein
MRQTHRNSRVALVGNGLLSTLAHLQSSKEGDNVAILISLLEIDDETDIQKQIDEIATDGVAETLDESREFFYRDMKIKRDERMILINGRVLVKLLSTDCGAF